MIKKFFKRLICIIMAIFFNFPPDIKRDKEKCNNQNKHMDNGSKETMSTNKTNSEIKSGKAAKLFVCHPTTACNCLRNIAVSDFAIVKVTDQSYYYLSRPPTNLTLKVIVKI